jgi:PIN domain nuclease of toxin-antitoxin system
MSPMVLFEYEVLLERRRFPESADAFIETLGEQIGLSLSTCPFTSILLHARTFAWTRDPFDRLIVANAMADGARLVTADTMILDNFAGAVW